MRKTRLLIIPILLASLLMGCATLGIGTPTDPTKMSPKQLATFAMGLYNRQYESYKTDIANPNNTAIQKEGLVKRKAIITKAWPIISAFDLLVASGQTPTADQQKAVIDLVAQLVSLIPQK